MQRYKGKWGDEESMMSVTELVASVLLADTSEIQREESIPYPCGKGDWLAIVGKPLGERVDELFHWSTCRRKKQ